MTTDPERQIALQRLAAAHEGQELRTEQMRDAERALGAKLDFYLDALDRGQDVGQAQAAQILGPQASKQLAEATERLEERPEVLRLAVELLDAPAAAEALGREAELLRATADSLDNVSRMVRLAVGVREAGAAR